MRSLNNNATMTSSIYSITQNILQADIGNHSPILLQTTEYYKRELEMNPYQTLEQIRRLESPPTSSHRLSWTSSCLNAGACLVLTAFGLVLGLHLVHLSLNRRSDIFCDFMSGQSVLATSILAQKYNLHFLKYEVWFRDFIR